MPPTTSQRLLRLLRSRKLVRAGEISAAGIHSEVTSRLVREGRVARVARGLYALPSRVVHEHHALVAVARSVPHAAICLLSALQFHGIGSELPSEVWIAIERRSRRPAINDLPLRVVRFSGAALTAGLETHRIEGYDVAIYGVAKTLADCFKYRNKIGLSVSLEALREAWTHRRFSMEELERYARICRVDRIMRPYLEVLVA